MGRITESLGRIARALFGRRAVLCMSAALAIYSLGIVFWSQIQHTYPTSHPPALEDLRTRSLPLHTPLRMPDSRVEGMFGHGWYGIESDGLRWSAGLSSTLMLPAQEPDVDLVLGLQLIAASDGTHPYNQVSVVLNGHELGILNVVVDRVEPYEVALPANIHQGYAALLTLNYEFTVQPSPSDQRDIAVRIMSLTLETKADDR